MVRIEQFCDNPKKLTPGNCLFVEHHSVDTPEMQGVGHTGYENVAKDREWVPGTDK